MAASSKKFSGVCVYVCVDWEVWKELRLVDFFLSFGSLYKYDYS